MFAWRAAHMRVRVEGEVRVPAWIFEPPVAPLRVLWAAEARATVEALVPADFRLFPDAAAAVAAIEEVLHSDPRSVGRRQRDGVVGGHGRSSNASEGTTEQPFRFALDRVDVHCRFADDAVTITHVDLLPRHLDMIFTAPAAGHPPSHQRAGPSRSHGDARLYGFEDGDGPAGA